MQISALAIGDLHALGRSALTLSLESYYLLANHQSVPTAPRSCVTDKGLSLARQFCATRSGQAERLVTNGERSWSDGDPSGAFGAFKEYSGRSRSDFRSARRLRSRFGDAAAGPLLGRRGDQKGVEEKVRGSYEKQEASGGESERRNGRSRGEEEEQEEYRSARGE